MRVLIVHQSVARDAPDSEQDVLDQVEAVSSAIRQLEHDVSVYSCTLDLRDLEAEVTRQRPDVVFNLVESLRGSDRFLPVVPMVLEFLQVPCTGASSRSLTISSDKLLAKQRLCLARLPTPAWRAPGNPAEGGDLLEPPYVIKAVTEHASLGLDDAAVVTAPDEDIERRLAQTARRLGCAVFAERYVAGREFNLSLIAGREGVDVLPPAEIDFSAFPPGKPRIVGYCAKWDAESFEYHHTPRRFVFPASDAPLLASLELLARRCWDACGLDGYARVDFRVDSAENPWIVDVNANPCLSIDAGFAAALASAGMSYVQAIDGILHDALRRGQRYGG